MKKVLIIGCGFAGGTAAQILCRLNREVEVTVIDRGKYFNFLPALPDIIGRGIDPEFLTFPIETLSKRLGFNFVNEEVTAVNLENNSVLTLSKSLHYDYLLIASGSETNFYGNNEIKKYAYKLDDANDARKIVEAVRQNDFTRYIISGGGYTGVEVATNLRVYLDKADRLARIIMVERGPSILGPLAQWMKDYCRGNLERLNIEVFTGSTIEKADKDNVYITGKGVFDKSMLIWAAGVKTAGYVQNLNAQKNPQGRLKVDEYLRIKENCFVAGDCAYYPDNGGYLRMAVQFSIFEAACVAKNILNTIRGKKLIKYKPVDLGYVIPMANNRSCGTILKINFKGFIPTAMHYVMCLYRTVGFRNRWGIISALLTGGGR